MMFRTHSRTHARGVNLYPAALYACGAIIAWAYAPYHEPITAVFAGFAFISLWHWMIDQWVSYRERLEKPYQPSDEVRITEAIAKMNAEQVWLTAYYLGYNLEPEQPPEPEVTEGITKSYAISALDKAAKKGGYLEPVRGAPDGTPERNRRELLADWLVSQGWATPAAGPKPARITDYQKARERILT